MNEPQKTELEKYQEWADKLIGNRQKTTIFPPIPDVTNPWKYQKYRILSNLVQSLFEEKMKGDIHYRYERSFIQRSIKEVVAMVMFIQEQAEEESKKHEQFKG